jgi:hypothetical protein
MKSLLTVSLMIAMTALYGAASAGQIWTDGNGDGLPDENWTPAPPSTNVTIGVWIDAQSFAWTNFLAYVEWIGDCSYVSASYVISGGSNLPIDNFSHPRGVGFSGFGYTQGGVDQIGTVTLHINSALVGCCVLPIIDIYNPYYVFSQLAAGSSYMIFVTNPATCYNGDMPAIGACCFCDGSCQVLTQDQCVAQEGWYNGDGTTCHPNPCSFNSICCLPTGVCSENYPMCACEEVGGIPYPGLTCEQVTCQISTQACCLPIGICVEETFETCVQLQGAPQGEGTSCDLVDCPSPFGACCLPAGNCAEMLESQCVASGGTWYQGLACYQIQCVNTVESRSWGSVKGLFR